jgi:predicted DNA-binding WGR domain protein
MGQFIYGINRHGVSMNENLEKTKDPLFLTVRMHIIHYFYKLPFKKVKYFVWKIKRIRFISKSLKFNLLHYFRDKSCKNIYIAKKPEDFQNYLSVVVIVKNEALYNEEWLEYHLLLGIQKFYLYDNESSDNLTQILQPYIKAGIVEYKYFPYTGKQVLAYNDILEKAKRETYWLAAIDIDEFIVLMENETIPDFLKDFEQYAGVKVNWLNYGSSGERHWRKELVIERFKKHEKMEAFWGRGVKTICNPRAVFKMDVHEPFYFRFAVAVNSNKSSNKYYYMDVEQVYNKIRINHYFTKSYDECSLKVNKGRVDGQGKYTLLAFEHQDKNDEYSDIMDKYILRVLANIEKRRKQG